MELTNSSDDKQAVTFRDLEHLPSRDRRTPDMVRRMAQVLRSVVTRARLAGRQANEHWQEEINEEYAALGGNPEELRPYVLKQGCTVDDAVTELIRRHLDRELSTIKRYFRKIKN